MLTVIVRAAIGAPMLTLFVCFFFAAGVLAQDVGQVATPASAIEVTYADQTEETVLITVDGIRGVAFTTSLYGTSPHPPADVIQGFERAYRELRELVGQRRYDLFGAALAGDRLPSKSDTLYGSFLKQPENVLAFAPPSTPESAIRQYYRDLSDSTDFLYVHVLEPARVNERSELDWRNQQIFLEGGGPATHFIRYDAVNDRIDQVAANMEQEIEL